MWRRILLAVVIGGFVGLVAGSLLSSDPRARCEEWQREYAHAEEETRGGILAYINMGPGAEWLQQLEDERPAGCTKP